jgi:pimeloyl-ACP methyl ester carboxylesterase
MPLVKANNINMFYEYEGKGSPLVIIGGFASVHFMFKDFIRPLKEHFKVLIFDNRGSGQTDVTPPPYSIETLAKDTIELMNSLNIENAYIIGHSMGSAILQRICYDYPEKVKKAILSGTFLKIPYTSQMIFEIIPQLIAKNLDEDLIKRLILPWIYSSDFLKNPDNVNNVLESMKKNVIDPKGYLGQAKALETFNSENWLSKVTSEILILVGKEDIDTPLYSAEKVHEKLKDAKYKIIENAAHMLFFEKPNESIKIIMDFFK